MSFTKFSKDVEKWLKNNDLPYRGTSNDTKEQTEERLLAWDKGCRHIFNEWIKEKRYKELISVAHSEWIKENIIFEPLADYFIQNHNLNALQFLCERNIRFRIEDLLNTIKYAQECEKCSQLLSVDIVSNFDLQSYHIKAKDDFHIAEVAKVREYILTAMNRYIAYLDKIKIAGDYLESIKIVRDKVTNLEIGKSDLKVIKNKLENI